MKLHEITSSKFPTTRQEVVFKLKQYKIENWTINPDLTVDVKGDVDLAEYSFTTIPIKFRTVYGNFNLFKCESITSLEGCPDLVTGSLNCNQCKSLSSFKGAPTFITNSFYCQGCTSLTSLEGINDHLKHIGGDLALTLIFIKNGGLGLLLSNFSVSRFGWTLPQFEIIRKYLGTDNIIECQSELIEAGFEDFAVL